MAGQDAAAQDARLHTLGSRCGRLRVLSPLASIPVARVYLVHLGPIEVAAELALVHDPSLDTALLADSGPDVVRTVARHPDDGARSGNEIAGVTVCILYLPNVG